MFINTMVDKLPGCCAFNVAHHFPTDSQLLLTKEDVMETTTNIQTLIREEMVNLITLNGSQKKTAGIITKLGFRAIGTVPGESGPVTLFVKGMRLLPTTVGVAKKKVAKKKVAKKTTRK